MFTLTQVSKRFGDAYAVRPLDLTIPAGATTVIIGPSGCGKSTLLRLMIGIAAPNTGAVAFDGVALTPANVLTARRRMGYVIQDGGLFPHLTARGNIELMPRHLSWPGRKRDQRIDELLALTQLPADALRRYPAELSGGQRQRVSLMRSLVLDPDALLLDEPLGALDPMIRHDLQTDLRAIFRKLAKTVVLVTHDLAEAAFFGDELLLMRAGDIVQRGTLEDFIRRPADAFVERFVNAQRAPAVLDEAVEAR